MAKIALPLLEIRKETVKKWLPKRKNHTHKGDYGKILLLCGSVGFTGAAALAAMGAARSGAGLIFVGVPQSVYPIVAGKLTEPMVFPLPDQDGKLSQEAIAEILERLAACDACLIGCGLGKSEGTYQVTKAVLEHADCPVVLDADGINVMQGHIDVLRRAKNLILTPHDGEFLRLGGEFGCNRLAAVQKLHCATGATVLLKGYRTLICGKEGCFINRCGNPGMARGGSGDVLAGIITSLLGQGLSATKAAALGAYLHGQAGDVCAELLGEHAMLPTDMIEALRYILK
ncbi:MAG: NAD(P)H-hydrate dehydratase [Ruminococcaceae bacterium]|nr:NAD(P)H-hydrate dehydratase [Oscillospiraceae bacterium]